MRTITPICEALDQRHQLEAYARQLSQSFEELSWLRSLAEHIEYCDASSQLAAVAARVLPSLCDVLSADSIALVHVADGTDMAGQCEDGSISVSCSVGEAKVPDNEYCQLVHQFGPQANGQPIVRNDLSENRAFSEAQPVKSAMLVRVAKNNQSYGWLVAVNKKCQGLDDRGSEGPRENRKSENEFGTIEAGLMDSAALMLATHARNAELFRESESLFIGVIRALVGVMDAKDPYTCGHSDRVAQLSRRLAKELGVGSTGCEQVYLAGLLHDIGKIGVADKILRKPGPLTDDEFSEIKKHPIIGFAILRHVQHLQHALPGVLHHHECMDGSGYPGELKGSETPLLARIISVADAYDAMTSDRPYRKALPLEKAESILRERAGIQWDSVVVDALFSALADIRAIVTDDNKYLVDDLTVGNFSAIPLADGIEGDLDGHLGACLSISQPQQAS